MPGTIIELFPHNDPEHEIEMVCAVFMSQHERLGQDSPLRLFGVKAVSQKVSEETQQTVFDKIARLLRCYTIEIDRGSSGLHVTEMCVLDRMQMDVDRLRMLNITFDDTTEIFDEWDQVERDLMTRMPTDRGLCVVIKKVLMGMTMTPGVARLGCDMLMLTYILLLLYQCISAQSLAQASEADAVVLSRIVRLCVLQLGLCMDTKGESLWTSKSSHTYRAQLLMRTIVKFGTCFKDDCKFCDALFCMTEPTDVVNSDGSLVCTLEYDRGIVQEMQDLVQAFFECPDFSVHDFVCTCIREMYIYALKHDFSVVDFIAFTFYEQYGLPADGTTRGQVCPIRGKNLLQSLFAQLQVQQGFQARVATFMLIACILFPMRVLGNGQMFMLLPHCVFSQPTFNHETRQALRFESKHTFARLQLMLFQFRLQVYDIQSKQPAEFSSYAGLIFGLPPSVELRRSMPSMLFHSINQLTYALEKANRHTDSHLDASSA